MISGFWEKLERPIVALAPMDGVTDLPCRTVVAKQGKPDLLFTEFVSAEGLFYAPDRLLRNFEYSEIERPIVAQLYGHRPEDFYRAVHVVCKLGFDGVDINMGCPSRKLVQKECGAGLITKPDLALEIIRATREGIRDWAKGQTLAPRSIPLSVKTRLGYDAVVIEKWVETLLKESPAAISIHGRTLRQMYHGAADWKAIGRAVEVAKGSGTLILGNGDLHSLEEASQRVLESGVDGVLFGRSAIGNPWIFRNKEAFRKAMKEGEIFRNGKQEVSFEERLKMALEHAQTFVQFRGEEHFDSLKKHLCGYLRHFPEAASFRHQAVRARSYEEIVKLLIPAPVS